MINAAERFWNLPEMHLQLALYMAQEDFRTLMRTSRANRTRFLADGWWQVKGIGNLMAILHDSLGEGAIGRGRPELQVPPIDQLNEDRILSFLMHAEVVQRVRVNANPEKFPRWLGLEQLLHLPALAGRQIVMPNVTHFSLEVSPKYRMVELAPFMQLMANDRLQQIWVKPNLSRDYPRSSLTDAESVLDTLTNRYGNECPLKWLAYYPETTQVENPRRDAIIQRLLPLTQNLCLFTTTAWSVSIPLLQALSLSPLERLEIQGRAPMPHFNMTMFGQIAFPEQAFARLRILLLQDVYLPFARHLLSSEQLIENVEILRIEICDINDVDLDEEAEYVMIYQRLAAFPRLRELTFTSSRSENRPMAFGSQFLQPVIDKRLHALRLFRVIIPGSQGFAALCITPPTQWDNLAALSVMHQDLSADDLIYFARLPNLIDLSGNVSLRLAQGYHGQITMGFGHHLTFASQFRFGIRYDATLDSRSLQKIIRILDSITPNGMTLRIDRTYVSQRSKDERDLVWVRIIHQRLQQAGKVVPNGIFVTRPHPQ